ncbi:MAG: histidinol dehydrogenase [Gammaproteobacteria bacterium]
MIKLLDTTSDDFSNQLASLREYESGIDEEINKTVKTILADVRDRGDAAVLEYTNRFDQRQLNNAEQFCLQSVAGCSEEVPREMRDALIAAHERIQRFHARQIEKSWQYEDNETILGQRITPLERVGVYVPGGKAAYPSSVLMNVVPAKVAGVDKIVMVVPAVNGEVDQAVLAAAEIAGVDRIFTIGGAQAVGALAYGTETVPAVDKIVGPGNAYVATAKQQVFGVVGIDMIAGPSEILVICDGDTDPEWIAMDLFSQAEHDEQAQAILISPDGEFLTRVERAIEKLLPSMARADIIKTSLSSRGALIKAVDMNEAIELSNTIAPEHLELSVADPQSLLPRIRNAGAIFLGRYTAEALGDYCAGPNHVLPTAGTARFFSPLGVYDFQKRTSIIQCSPKSSAELGEIASTLAHGERLQAHARSAEYRIKSFQS